MRDTLIAIAACGLMTGACSLRSPEGGGAYSMLQTGSVAATTPAGSATAAEIDVAAAPRMPGDLTRPIAERSGSEIAPLAALGASARARSHWEALHPKDVATRKPSLSALSPVDASTPAALSDTPTASSEAPVKAKPDQVDNYDREAKMQGLINGGRAAGRGICSGC